MSKCNLTHVVALSLSLANSTVLSVNFPCRTHRYFKFSMCFFPLQNLPIYKIEYVFVSLAEPTDIADGAVFLLSDLAKMINGTILHIDGGLTSV